MKSKILIFILIINGFIFSQNKYFVIGAEANYLNPISELSNRFKPTLGYDIYFGVQTSKNWMWSAKVEYFKYDKTNFDKLKIRRTVTVGFENKAFEAQLSKLNMKLEVIGLNLMAKYNLINTNYLDLNVDLGFGINRWVFWRDAYDSLTVDTSSIPNNPKYYNLITNAPGLSQNDWSGGFNLGIDLNFKINNQLSFTVNANYKNILGELWAAMGYDMENVATIQMLSFSGGVRYSFR